MKVDGLVQHYNALVYLGIWVRGIIRSLLFDHTLSIPLWDHNIGYGSDIITTLHYYVIGDPLDLLTVFVPSRYTEYLYNALVIVRMYLAGAAFSLFCLRMKKDRMAVLAGSIAYTFCGYMIYAATRHPFFVGPMIYLPLLLIGVEDIYRRKKATVFIWMVFVSAVSNIYFFYMLVFAVVFYVVARFFTLERVHRWKDLLMYLLYFSWYGLLGVMMSGLILFPTFLLLTQGMRGDIEIIYPLFYSREFYQRLLTRFLTPESSDTWTVLGFAAPVLVGLFVMFSRKKKRGVLKISFAIMVLMLCIPEIGRAMNGFSYVSNRWCFIFAALVCYIFVDVWPDMVALESSRKISVAIFSGIYYLILLLPEQGPSEAAMAGMGMLLLVLGVILVEPKIKRYGGVFPLTPYLILGATVIHVCVIGFFRYGHNESHALSSFMDRGKALTLVEGDATSLAARMMDRASFGRVDLSKRYLRNASIITKVPTTQFFWSMENGNVSKYLLDMCMAGMRTTFCYDGLEQRTALEALGSVKYYIREAQDGGLVPYGFEKMRGGGAKKHKDPYEIFKNRYALPLGYTYPSYLTHEVFDPLDPVQKQEALLQGILLEEEDMADLPDTIGEADPVFTGYGIPYRVKCGKGVRQEGEGGYRSSRKNSKITLTIHKTEGCELYLFATGVRARAETERGLDSIYNDLEHTDFKITVCSGEGSGTIAYKTPCKRSYCGQEDFLVNLGYQEEARTEITVTFPIPGRYQLEDLQVICQPMGHYVEQVNALREDVLEDEEIGVDHIKGSVTLEKDKILCLTVPYCKGWTAYVDGVEKPLYKANEMYMALPLTAGKHTVGLYYETYGLRVGLCISGTGVLLFLSGCIKRRKESRHPR